MTEDRHAWKAQPRPVRFRCSRCGNTTEIERTVLSRMIRNVRGERVHAGWFCPHHRPAANRHALRSMVAQA